MKDNTEVQVRMTWSEWDNLVKLIAQAIHPERTRLIPPEIDRLREYQRKIRGQIGDGA